MHDRPHGEADRATGALRIAELARRTGVTVKTIRYYESIGVLTPPARTPAGYRVYDEPAVQRLRFVVGAQVLGFTLAEIAVLADVLEGRRDRAEHEELLHIALRRADQRIRDLQVTRAALAAIAAGP